MHVNHDTINKIQHDFNNGLMLTRVIVDQLQDSIEKSSCLANEKIQMQEAFDILLQGVKRMQDAMENMVAQIEEECHDL